MLHRRQFLRIGLAATGAAAAGLRAGRALAIGESELFRFGQLQLGQSWNPRPSALRRMSWEVDKRTSVSVGLEPRALPLRGAGARLHETPFLYLAGDREFAIPSEPDVEALRRFLTFGGFLLIDSAEGATGGAFDGSVRQLIETLYPAPATGLEIVPRDHVVYRSFYRLEQPVGRLALSPTMDGVMRDGRMVVAYVQNDLGGAWARDNFGNYEMPCEPGGERQREMAFRLGVNLVMYALCLDYKSDQVHVEYLMRKRPFRPQDGAEEASPGNR
ncbi:MAG TPA: DUF4159 domain-containing protein [Kofleriaceae bacterium]|nr:DUF4159 domain-containing protein [Kofleriaceae bacterium]